MCFWVRGFAFPWPHTADFLVFLFPPSALGIRGCPGCPGCPALWLCGLSTPPAPCTEGWPNLGPPVLPLPLTGRNEAPRVRCRKDLGPHVTTQNTVTPNQEDPWERATSKTAPACHVRRHQRTALLCPPQTPPGPLACRDPLLRGVPQTPGTAAFLTAPLSCQDRHGSRLPPCCPSGLCAGQAGVRTTWGRAVFPDVVPAYLLPSLQPPPLCLDNSVK